MAKTARKMAGVVMAGAMLMAPRPVAAADAATTVSAADQDHHVRSSNTAIVALIEQASERSATFRHLLDTLNASDSMVYVEQGDCPHGVRACFTSVTIAGSRRVMWVKVDTRKADWDLMGSIGHELRHTIEVLGDPTVTSNSAMYFFYLTNGSHGRTKAFETQAAIDAGTAVRREARAAVRSAKAE
jgi:hypothetical protein